MMDIIHGLAYCVILKDKVDLFDIVPDLMKTSRSHWQFVQHGFIDNSDNKVSFMIVVNTDQAEDRWRNCRLYKSDEDTWWHSLKPQSYSFSQNFLETVDQIKVPDMKPTSEELLRQKILLDHPCVKNNVHDIHLPGWYDHQFSR